MRGPNIFSEFDLWLLNNRKFLKKAKQTIFIEFKGKTKKKLKNGSVDLFIFGGQIQAARLRVVVDPFLKLWPFPKTRRSHDFEKSPIISNCYCAFTGNFSLFFIALAFRFSQSLLIFLISFRVRNLPSSKAH